MKQIEIVSGVMASRLGFGCGSILGRVDGRAAELALDLALSLGVNYFDIAPSYGFGDAEAWLGRRIQSQRDSLVITTKYGIHATKLARALRPVKPVFRMWKKYRGEVNVIDPGATKGALLGGYLLGKSHLTAKGLRKSVEKSIKRLRTDRVECLMIHEPEPFDNEFDSLVEAASDLKKDGKIRGFGLSLNLNNISDFERYTNHFDVFQFNPPYYLPECEKMRIKKLFPRSIIHSPFSGLKPGESRSERLKRISIDFPISVAVCSMFNPAHIKENVNVFGN